MCLAQKNLILKLTDSLLIAELVECYLSVIWILGLWAALNMGNQQLWFLGNTAAALHCLQHKIVYNDQLYFNEVVLHILMNTNSNFLIFY